MIGSFEIYRDKRGEFRFRLKAGNGQIILASEGYASKGGCENGINSVRSNSQNYDRFERLESKSGGLYFNLKSSNGQVVGTSEMYSSKAGLENGIFAVKTNALNAMTYDLS